MQRLEARFEKKVRLELRALPNSWIPDKLDSVYLRGIPDLLGCVNGTMIAIELKKDLAESRKQTGRIVLQKYVLNNIKRAGGFTAIAWPDNWPLILDELKHFCGVK